MAKMRGTGEVSETTTHRIGHESFPQRCPPHCSPEQSVLGLLAWAAERFPVRPALPSADISRTESLRVRSRDLPLASQVWEWDQATSWDSYFPHQVLPDFRDTLQSAARCPPEVVASTRHRN